MEICSSDAMNWLFTFILEKRNYQAPTDLRCLCLIILPIYCRVQEAEKCILAWLIFFIKEKVKGKKYLQKRNV